MEIKHKACCLHGVFFCIWGHSKLVLFTCPTMQPCQIINLFLGCQDVNINECIKSVGLLISFFFWKLVVNCQSEWWHLVNFAITYCITYRSDRMELCPHFMSVVLSVNTAVLEIEFLERSHLGFLAKIPSQVWENLIF